MSSPTKLPAFWLIVAAVPAFVLGALLFKGCGKAQLIERVRYIQPNMDSLKATIPPDTVEVSGKQIIRFVTVPVLLSDTALVDSLKRAYEAQKVYYEGLISQLTPQNENWGWDWSTIELKTKENFYADSVTTEKYFHKWNITAEGPITRYTYQIIPICPTLTAPLTKKHYVGLTIGGQFADGLIRPIYGAQYRYRFLTANAGYLPKSKDTKGAFQIQLGFFIGLY